MSRTPKTNPKIDPDVIRISFLLDLKVHKELERLRDMHGHGERPRELLHLAKLGLKRQEDDNRILDLVRAQHGVQPLVLSTPAGIGKAGAEAATIDRSAIAKEEATQPSVSEASQGDESGLAGDAHAAPDTSEFSAPIANVTANRNNEDEDDDDRPSSSAASAFLA